MRPSVPGRTACIAVALALLFAGCASGPAHGPEPVIEPAPSARQTEAVKPGEPEQTAVAEEKQEAPAEEPEAEPVAEAQEPKDGGETTEAEAPASSEQSPEIAAEPASPPATAPTEPAEYQVTTALYSQTFSELERRILDWNALIARKDYDSWYANLSRAYVKERGSPAYLAEVSRSKVLRDRGIELKSLRDYFLNVVVPARVDAGLSRIEFVDEREVKAYADVGGAPTILYYVVKEDGVWKIGTEDECRTASRTE